MGTTRVGISIALATLVGCGGSAPARAPHPPPSPLASPPVAREELRSGELHARAGEGLARGAPPEETGVEIPRSCQDANPCLPDAAFASRICQHRKPDIALAMFAKGTPWSRAYVRYRNIVAWAAAGAVTERLSLEFDEEVILVRRRTAPTGGMVMEGAADSYDVIRWDGSCVTLDSNELTVHLPPAPKTPQLPWKRYDQMVQEALLADRGVATANKTRRRECRGATLGEVSPECAKANDALSRAVVRYVRSGGNVPAPTILR